MRKKTPIKMPASSSTAHMANTIVVVLDSSARKNISLEINYVSNIVKIFLATHAQLPMIGDWMIFLHGDYYVHLNCHY